MTFAGISEEGVVSMEAKGWRVIELRYVKRSVREFAARHVCHAEWLGIVALATVVAFILAQRFGWF